MLFSVFAIVLYVFGAVVAMVDGVCEIPGCGRPATLYPLFGLNALWYSPGQQTALSYSKITLLTNQPCSRGASV
jgi:hypothetical protein